MSLLAFPAGRPAPSPDSPSLRGPRFGHVGPIQPEGFYEKPRNLKGKPHRFVVAGDSGGGQSFRQLFLGPLESLMRTRPFQSILLLGDNVYGTSENGAHPQDGAPALFDDRLWQGFRSLIKQGVELFPILGNHDVRTAQEAEQLAYVNVPRYYQFTRGNVDFFALDTTVLLPSYDKCYNGRIDFAHQTARAQLEWLDQALAKSQSKFKVVMGHYPMYCSGRYNNRGINAELVRAVLQPLLVKHQVDAYLCGHEHHYERSKAIYGITHFLTGSASKITTKVHHAEDPPYPREVLKREHQLMLFEETDQGLAYQSINNSGEVIDSGLLPPKDRTALPAALLEPVSVDKLLGFLRFATQFLHRDAS